MTAKTLPPAPTPKGRPLLLYGTWALLALEAVEGVARGHYTVSFVAVGTLILTLVPLASGRMLRVDLPSGFISAIAVFLSATLVLGEAQSFYARYWWWDLALHAGSAMGFGLVGTVLMLILVRDDRLSASPFTVSVFAFSFAVMIGVLWEMFEFFMDQTFGLNMQKSGLVDTMWDLILNCLGGAVGAGAGWLYLKGYRRAPLASWIREFVQKNGRYFDRGA